MTTVVNSIYLPGYFQIVLFTINVRELYDKSLNTYYLVGGYFHFKSLKFQYLSMKGFGNVIFNFC